MCYEIFKIIFKFCIDSGNPRHPNFQTSAPPQHQSSSYGNQSNGSRGWRQYVQGGSSSIASNTSANQPGNPLAYSNPSIHWSSNNPSIGHYPVAPPNSPASNYPTHVNANVVDYNNQYQWRTFSPGTMISFVTQPQQNAGGNQNQHANVQHNTMPAGRDLPPVATLGLLQQVVNTGQEMLELDAEALTVAKEIHQIIHALQTVAKQQLF